MGAGQVKYFILIPKNDKNPVPPAFTSKRPRSCWLSTFSGPMTARNYENRQVVSTAFTLFFQIISEARFFTRGPAQYQYSE